MKTIEIPDDLYTELLEETLKKGYREVHILIRNLLHQKRNQGSVLEDGPRIINGGGKNLVTKGGSIPNDAKLRCTYKGQLFSAVVDNGGVLFSDGYKAKSLSAAANYVQKLLGNPNPSVNGWKFWEFFDTKTSQWKTLESLRQHSIQNGSVADNQIIKNQEVIFMCKEKRANARGRWSGDKFAVLKGSNVNSEETPSLQQRYREIRRRLLQDGVLRRENDRLVFTCDVKFNSLSEAACVVLGRSANGKTEWRI